MNKPRSVYIPSYFCAAVKFSEFPAIEKKSTHFCIDNCFSDPSDRTIAATQPGHGTLGELFQRGFPKYPVWGLPVGKHNSLLAKSNVWLLFLSRLFTEVRMGGWILWPKKKSRSLYFHWVPSVSTLRFFNKLWWVMTLFEFDPPTDIPQNTNLNNGSLVGEVWKHEGTAGIYTLGHTKSYMQWESRWKKKKHTHPPNLLITLDHFHNPGRYSPYPRASEVKQVQEYFQTDSNYTLDFSSAHPGHGLVPSLPHS